MLDDRKAAILRAVVESHIQTAQPVSSAYVAQLGDLSVSPATVRNEMVLLEQDGYLFQPHSSAGRVPTDKGYRFFVDSLAGPAPLGPAQAELVRGFFARKHGEIERTLAETSSLLSRLTDYAALVVAPSAPEPGRVRSVQLVKLAPLLVLAVAVMGNGVVERRSLELGSPLTDEQVAMASATVASFLVGGALDRAGGGSGPGAGGGGGGGPSSGGAGEPGSGSGSGGGAGGGGVLASCGNPAADALARAAVDALRRPDNTDVPAAGHVFVGGAARMAAAFEAVSTIRTVLGILEEQYMLVTLLRDVLDSGLTVAIGTEHGILPLAECSVVIAPYEVDGERAGTVGVLGPTRMHYDQAMAAVAVVSNRLTKALSEGSGEGPGATARPAPATGPRSDG